MTISHHPSEETLAEFVAGTLSEGNLLVVAAHIAGCARCRAGITKLSELGGRALEDMDAMPLSVDAKAKCLAHAGGIEVPAPLPKPVVSEKFDPLALYERGPWRWIGPGVHRQDIRLDDETDTRVFLLKAAPGTRLPDHRHTGSEWTYVMQGAFRHDKGRFGAGDFDEAGDDVEHNPQVEEGQACICLVAMSGEITLKSRVGQLFSRFVRV